MDAAACKSHETIESGSGLVVVGPLSVELPFTHVELA